MQEAVAFDPERIADLVLQPITRSAFLALVKLSPQFAYQMLASLAERLRFLTARL